MQEASIFKRIPAWMWVAGVLVLFALWMVSVYNGLIMSQGSVQSSWAQVEVEYQRRSDMVAQVLPVVQGAADFEQSTLLEVTEARTNWLATQSDPSASINDQIASSNAFDSAISRLLVSVEAYPTLTATEGFQTFQAQLEGNENRVAVSRMDYNNAATNFNVKIRKIPTNLLAGLFGFEAYTLFESTEGTEEAPTVDFDFGN